MSDKENFATNNELVDIKDIHIDMELPKEKRIENYISQIKNPFRFRFDNMIVTINFDEHGKKLEDILHDLIMTLHNSH